MPSPADHLRLLIELMQPASPELARRWLAALLLVPREEREAVVASIEARINQLYPMQPAVQPEAQDTHLEIIHPPRPHAGYTEQVHTTYTSESSTSPRQTQTRLTHRKQA